MREIKSPIQIAYFSTAILWRQSDIISCPWLNLHVANINLKLVINLFKCGTGSNRHPPRKFKRFDDALQKRQQLKESNVKCLLHHDIDLASQLIFLGSKCHR